MKKRYLDVLGRDASVIVFGTVPVGSSASETESFAMLDAYAAMGGNFIDLARAYGDGAAEETVGRWLRRTPSDMIIATKGGLPGADKQPRLDRASLLSDIRKSLDALGIEQVDMYWLHRDDPARDVEDILHTANALVQMGYTRCVGVSNWGLDRIREAQDCALTKGYLPFAASQPQWSLARMEIYEDPTLVQMDDAMRLWHEKNRLPCIPFSSQAKGFFQKLATGGEDALSAKAKRRYLSPRNLRIFDAVMDIHRQTGLSVGGIALGYLTSQSFPVFPIAGASSVAQVQAWEACDLPGWAMDMLQTAIG